ncbi:hypothetical protein TNCV_2221661 [Trichonephila clavipes]|nr:hypothetical protein TNCV_2221661 [Trichonephila clavipes]
MFPKLRIILPVAVKITLDRYNATRQFRTSDTRPQRNRSDLHPHVVLPGLAEFYPFRLHLPHLLQPGLWRQLSALACRQGIEDTALCENALSPEVAQVIKAGEICQSMGRSLCQNFRYGIKLYSAMTTMERRCLPSDDTAR